MIVLIVQKMGFGIIVEMLIVTRCKILTNQRVICVFERDSKDLQKGELIKIFENWQDVEEYIKNAKIDLFWEEWQITKRRNG